MRGSRDLGAQETLDAWRSFDPICRWMVTSPGRPIDAQVACARGVTAMRIPEYLKYTKGECARGKRTKNPTKRPKGERQRPRRRRKRTASAAMERATVLSSRVVYQGRFSRAARQADRAGRAARTSAT